LSALSLDGRVEAALSEFSPASKVWYVTGASRRFGRLIAKGALDRGDAVVATARRPDAFHQ